MSNYVLKAFRDVGRWVMQKKVVLPQRVNIGWTQAAIVLDDGQIITVTREGKAERVPNYFDHTTYVRTHYSEDMVNDLLQNHWVKEDYGVYHNRNHMRSYTITTHAEWLTL